MEKTRSLLWPVLFALALMVLVAPGCGDNSTVEQSTSVKDDLTSTIVINQGWSIQSAGAVNGAGDIISSAGFSTEGWYPASVPSTVLAALVANQVYPDPYFGMNLRSIPGTTYPIGSNFSNLPMPVDSPFRPSWWYRTEFFLPAIWEGRSVYLNFNGINFRANIWMNGFQVADSKEVAGTYRTYVLDVSTRVLPGENNSLAVEVFPPETTDLAHNWVDWNPMPPDKDMGIWREVTVTAGGPVRLRTPHVVTHLELPSMESAQLTITAEVCNTSTHAAKGSVNARIEDAVVSQDVELDPQQVKKVTFSSDSFPQLIISNPRVWWPNQLGPQNLYSLEVTFEYDNEISDRQSVRFGIREVASELDEFKHRRFRINGKNILIRGAGWAQDMMFRSSPEREEAEIRYVRDLNLNTIRFEGKLGTDHLFDLCDQYGILVMAGWCCCDHWERWGEWNDEDFEVAAESLKSQVCRLRNHPSMVAWLNGSDYRPPSKVEQMYVDILREYEWPNPFISSATETASPVTGISGVKMTGPYEYVPPVYWLTDKEHGGAFGFNTETSPGPAIPPVESLRKMLPEEELWPIDDVWNYHAGGKPFYNLGVFNKALMYRYGLAVDLEDYVKKAQAMNYEAQRAMFEAYARNKYSSTGVIQWMLNNAWPSVIWHLYDYCLRPAGGYFGTKKACEPLHVQYSYDDRSIVVVNSYYQSFRSMKVEAKVHDLDLTEHYSRQETLDVPPDSSVRVFEIPELQGLSRTYFIRLRLDDASGETVSSNFYWLSTKPDLLAWVLSDWYHTPIVQYGDLTNLQSLPSVEVKVSGTLDRALEEDRVRVTLENQASHLAFLTHLRIVKDLDGEEVLPILWEDNYVSLMPGERKEITAAYQRADLEGSEPEVAIDGWNVSPFVQAVVH